MLNIKSIGRRNRVTTEIRKYSLSSLISESYRTLYDCEPGTKLYKLAEAHIEDVRNNPTQTDKLSENLCYLKQLVKLGESAKIREEELAQTTPDENLPSEETNQKVGSGKPNVLNEEEDPDCIDCEEELMDEEDLDYTDDNMMDDEEDMVEEEDDMTDEEPDLSTEELQELRSIIRERKNCREAADEELPPVEEETPMSESKGTKMKESNTWKSHQKAMAPALKKFRESSSSKAFYKTLSKMSQRLKENDPLTIQESLSLYKATNSAMTHLAVELEHNPEFIYTFRECSNLLSRDTQSLLESIQKNQAPSREVTESVRAFSNILLENYDEFDDEEDMMDETPVTEEDDMTDEEPLNLPDEEDLQEEDDMTDEELPSVEEETPNEEPALSSEELQELRSLMRERKNCKK